MWAAVVRMRLAIARLPWCPATALFLINSYIPSECNLNLLGEATYFLKLIAIFVDLA